MSTVALTQCGKGGIIGVGGEVVWNLNMIIREVMMYTVFIITPVVVLLMVMGGMMRCSASGAAVSGRRRRDLGAVSQRLIPTTGKNYTRSAIHQSVYILYVHQYKMIFNLRWVWQRRVSLQRRCGKGPLCPYIGCEVKTSNASQLEVWISCVLQTG